MTEQEISVKLTETEQRAKSNTHRIEKLEQQHGRMIRPIKYSRYRIVNYRVKILFRTTVPQLMQT